jgi:dipeptidyl aminopeptidase/acylaminoacyl peptidase
MRISGITCTVRKTHTTRKVVLSIIVLLLLAVLAVVILSFYKGWLLLHPDKKPMDTFSSNIVPEYRDISFKGSDSSIVLKGWLFQAKSSDRAVILVHSYGSNRLEFGIETVDLIKGFLNRGYNVFTFDLRNSGKSDGKITTFGYSEKDDVLAAIKYMNSQGSKHITLMGFSSGASASILAACENSTVDAVIADSPYSDLKSYFQNNINIWSGLPSFPFNKIITLCVEMTGEIDMEAASPISALTADTPPHMLLIHSKNDNIIPVENSIELYQTYSALNPLGAEFWMTETEGHAGAYKENKDKYLEKVFAFMDKVYSE